MADFTALIGLFVATLGGAAIGVERQRSGHASGRHARFGGVRTFTLLGGVSGLAGWFVATGTPGVATLLVAAAVAIVVAGYVAASRRDVDATTEMAGLVVVAAGVLAGTGYVRIASGSIAVTVLLLVEKSWLHATVRRIDSEEIRAAARFAVMAVVILPLLPAGPYGPFGGVRPRELWIVVLFFTGLSFAGFIARRSVGARRGYPVAGVLGGIISSTSVTFTFARLSRVERALAPALAIGAIGACTVLIPRVLTATLVLNPAVARALVPYLVVPFAIGLVAFAAGVHTRLTEAEHLRPMSNPLQIGPALQMALTFQLVLFAVTLARTRFGSAGLFVSGAVLGLTDVDALTISMSQSASGGTDAGVAARAIAIGILSNSILKAGLAVALGTPRFARLTCGVLGAMALALVVALVIL